MPDNRILFIASHLSRRIITLAKRMRRDGYDIYIAAPANENLQYLSKGRFIGLGKFFGRLFGRGRVRHWGGKIVCFGARAENFAKGMNAPIAFTGDIGIDLSVWNPKATSGNRQTMLMNKYNIPPHSKMILVVEPSEKDIKALIPAMQGLSQDFILALYGKMNRRAAKRVSRRIKSMQIAYLGNEADLPSLMRASFAVLSLSPENSFFKIAALAMGRVSAFPPCGIKPNIVIKNNLPSVLEQILTMPIKTREAFEAENLRRANAYDVEKSIAKLKKQLAM